MSEPFFHVLVFISYWALPLAAIITTLHWFSYESRRKERERRRQFDLNNRENDYIYWEDLSLD